jgi:hypothetical protein
MGRNFEGFEEPVARERHGVRDGWRRIDAKLQERRALLVTEGVKEENQKPHWGTGQNKHTSLPVLQ